MKAGEYVWDDELTWTFLKLYRDNLDKFRNPQIRNKEIYITLCEELLEKYPKEPLTPQLLTKKFFNLKRTHEKILIKKCSSENYDVQWKFFETMTKLLNNTSSNDVVIESSGNKGETSFKFEYAWKDNVTYEFLDLYLDRIDEFKNPKIRNKNIFSNIAASLKLSFPDLPLTAGIVQKKFYNMKRTYLDIVQKKSTNKKYPINWKFFNKVHAIMSLTDQIKVEYVTYDFDSKEISFAEPEEYEEPSPKKFKKEYVTTDMEDINFDDYVEYENVEYEVEETYGDKHEHLNKSSDAIQMVSKFDIEMDQHEEMEEEDDVDNEPNLDEEEFEHEPELDTGEIIDLHMVDGDDDEEEEEDKQDESANEDQQHSSQLQNEVFANADSNDKTEVEVPTSTSSKNELTPFMKAKLDIEAKKVALLEKIYNIQTERTDIDRDTLRVQKENNELLRKLLKVMTSNVAKK